MTETITGKVEIQNPDQASTNFYWTYETEHGAFNLQTTIRGILSYEQIQAHLNSALSATAYVVSLGGMAKQVGRSETPAASLPVPTPVDQIITEVVKNDPTLVSEESVEYFTSEKLEVNISNGKKFFKVKGGQWKKYGVTVWPEVLVAAGIPVEKLESKPEGYKLEGYKAYFSRKEDGNPLKITKLEKG